MLRWEKRFLPKIFAAVVCALLCLAAPKITFALEEIGSEPAPTSEFSETQSLELTEPAAAPLAATPETIPSGSVEDVSQDSSFIAGAPPATPDELLQLELQARAEEQAKIEALAATEEEAAAAEAAPAAATPAAPAPGTTLTTYLDADTLARLARARQTATDAQAARITDDALADTSTVTLWKIAATGEVSAVSGFTALPDASEYANYLVHVARISSSDLILPVVAMQEAAGGYRVTVSLEGTSAFPSIENRQLSLVVPKINSGTTTITVDGQEVAAYTNFDELIAAMRQDMAGTYYLTGDMQAAATTSASYLEAFSGTLIGNPAATPTIHGLTRPLFSAITGATIKNINFAGVAINSNSGNIGVLAQSGTGNARSTITNVHAWGTIIANGGGASVGGIVGSLQAGTIENCSFVGSINTGGNVQNTGGLFGAINAQSDLKYSYVDATITAASTQGNHTVGGLVGWLVGTAAQFNYVAGTLSHTGSSSPNVGGVFGGGGGRITTTVITIQVTGTEAYLIHGNNDRTPSGYDFNHMTLYVLEGLERPLAPRDSQNGGYGLKIVDFAADDLAARLQETGITLVEQPQGLYDNHEFSDVCDLTQQDTYAPDRRVAYGNAAKFMPLAGAKELVAAGNALAAAGGRLASVVVRSVTALDADGRLTDYISDGNSVAYLLINFADGLTETHKVTGFSGTGASLAFTIAALPAGVAYMPEHAGRTEQAVKDATIPADVLQILEKLQEDVKGKEYTQTKTATYDEDGTLISDGEFLHSQEYKNFFGISDDSEIQEMYLDAPFKRAMRTVVADIISLVANSEVADLSNPTIQRYYQQKVAKNRIALTVGLAYLAALYDFDFAPAAGSTETPLAINAADLLTKHIEFYGLAQSNGLDQVIEIGSIDGHHHWNNRIESIPVDLNIGSNVRSGKDGFYGAAHNLAVYQAKFASKTGMSDVASFLQGTHDLLLPREDVNDWFKRTSKARIVEVRSTACPEADVRIFHRLSGYSVNVRTGAPLNANSAIYMGMLLPLLCVTQNDVYIGVTMTSMQFGLAERIIDKDLFTKYYNDPETYADQWKSANESFDKQLEEAAYTWGAYFDAWYNIVDDVRRDNMVDRSLYAWDSYNIKGGWVDYYTETVPAAIEFIGPVAWHEPSRGFGAVSWGPNVAFIVDTFLDHWGLSSYTHEMTHSYDSQYYFFGYGRRQGIGGDTFASGFFQSPRNGREALFALNLAFDYTSDYESKNSPHIPRPDLISGQDYINHYEAGLWNLIYLLDYAQAMATLKLSPDYIQKLYVTVNPNGGGAGADRYTGNISLELAEQLKNFDDLVMNNIAGSGWANTHWGGNTYARVSLTNPSYVGYATTGDTQGTTDTSIFIRRAFELMGTYGYKNGMVAYGSGQYNGHSDTYILEQISKGAYTNFYDFEKDAYKARRDIAWTLRNFAIAWEDAEGGTITSFEDIQKMMDYYLAQYQAAFEAIPDAQARVDEATKKVEETKAAYDATGWEEANQRFKASGEPNNNSSELFRIQDEIWKNGGQATQRAWQAAQREQRNAQNALRNAQNAPNQWLTKVTNLKNTLINHYNYETNNYQTSIFDGAWQQAFTAEVGSVEVGEQAADGSVRLSVRSITGRRYAAGTQIAFVGADGSLQIVGSVADDGSVRIANASLPEAAGTVALIALEANKAFTTASGVQAPAFSVELPARIATSDPVAQVVLAYDANGGVGAAVSEVHEAADSVSLKDGAIFTRKGYTLVGWSADQHATAGSATVLAPGATYTMPAASTTLYAIWQAKTYTVHYTAALSDSAVADRQVMWDDTNLAATVVPVRRGYNFAGWKLAGARSTIQTGESFASLVGDDDATGAITLNAVWDRGAVPDPADPSTANPNFAVVTYSVQGAGSVSTSSEVLHILDGNIEPSTAGRPKGSAVLSAAPGYRFAYWTWKNADGTTGILRANQVSPAKNDANEYFSRAYTAVFEPVSYQVRFAATDANVEGTMIPQTLTYDTPAQLREVSLSRPGYRFVGWATTPGGEKVYDNMAEVENLTTTDGATVELYALWASAQNSVSFVNSDPSKGTLSGTGLTLQVLTGDKASMDGVEIAATGNNTFSGWSYTMVGADGTTITGSAAHPEELTIVGETTFTALWASLLSVSYLPGLQGDFEAETYDNLSAGAAISEAAAFSDALGADGNPKGKLGWTFAGWRDQAGTTYAPGQALPTIQDNTTYVFTAQWTAKTYTVIYDLQGAETSLANKEQVTWGAADLIPAAAPVRRGYNFMGWYTTPTGVGAQVDAATTYSALAGDDAQQSVTLYARWDWGALPPAANPTQNTNPNFAVLSFVASTGGAVDTAVEVLHITEGDVSSGAGRAPRMVRAQARRGYRFSHWTWVDEAGQEQTSDALELTPTKDSDGAYHTRTYTAVFAPYTYTVRFSGNAANVTGSMADETFAYGSAQELSANGFTHPGYTFMGWATTPTGQVAYRNAQSVRSLTDSDGAIVELFAIWAAANNNVTFISSDATAGRVVGTKLAQQVATEGHVSMDGVEVEPYESYAFAGWSYSMVAPDGVSRMQGTVTDPQALVITGDATFAALWALPLSVDYLPGEHGAWNVDAEGTSYESLTAGTQLGDVAPYQGPVTNMDRTPQGKPGWTFAGWRDQAGNVYTTVQPTLVLEADLAYVFTALWQAKVYSVSYNVEGLDDAAAAYPSRDNVHFDSTSLIPASDPVREGYSFAGWFTQPHASGVRVDAQTSYAALVAGDDSQMSTVLYAAWTANTPTPDPGPDPVDPTPTPTPDPTPDEPAGPDQPTSPDTPTPPTPHEPSTPSTPELPATPAAPAPPLQPAVAAEPRSTAAPAGERRTRTARTGFVSAPLVVEAPDASAPTPEHKRPTPPAGTKRAQHTRRSAAVTQTMELPFIVVAGAFTVVAAGVVFLLAARRHKDNN